MKFDTFKLVFIVSILVLSIINILGLIYITKMSFSKYNGDCGVTKIEKNITKMTVILLWLQIGMIILGSIINTSIGRGIITITDID